MKKIKIVAIVAILVIATQTSIASAAYLTVGSRGNDVVNLQSWLTGQGFPIPSIENGKATPGYFGPQTEDAVKMYQESKGLSLTGSIDSNVILGEEPKLGSVVGPDFYTPYFNINGVRTWYYSSPALNGASTTCAYRLPNATTTIQMISFSASSLASSTDLEIGTDPTAYATTTSIVLARTIPTGGGFISVGQASTSASYSYFTNSANGSAVIQASPMVPTITGSVGSTAKYLVFKLGYNGITGSTPATVGQCKAVLTQIDNQN